MMGPSREGEPASGRPPVEAPRLVAPTIGLHASFLEALRECRAEGRHEELPLEALADPAEFARYVLALRDGVVMPGEPDRHLARLTGRPLPAPPEGGYVPQTVLWWVQEGEFLGRVNVRHYLTEGLLREGGNIGYEVRPSVRRRGHATAMLAAALPVAADLGIELAHLDCTVDNVASRRVIEKNGGRLEREEHGNLYFLVPTSPRR
jgi:RimJ/RimL family protein N-acetyltransferase